jgi:hypothetical protein
VGWVGGGRKLVKRASSDSLRRAGEADRREKQAREMARKTEPESALSQAPGELRAVGRAAAGVPAHPAGAALLELRLVRVPA